MRQNPGRLALRSEGSDWVAYWARPDSMDGALEISRIKLKFVSEGSSIKKDYIELMEKCLALAIKEVIGADVKWDEPTPAPESERMGNA